MYSCMLDIRALKVFSYWVAFKSCEDYYSLYFLLVFSIVIILEVSLEAHKYFGGVFLVMIWWTDNFEIDNGLFLKQVYHFSKVKNLSSHLCPLNYILVLRIF